jgi:hypothetical protein
VGKRRNDRAWGGAENSGLEVRDLGARGPWREGLHASGDRRKKRGVGAPKRPEKTALQRENGPAKKGERLEEEDPGHLP